MWNFAAREIYVIFFITSVFWLWFFIPKVEIVIPVKSNCLISRV